MRPTPSVTLTKKSVQYFIKLCDACNFLLRAPTPLWDGREHGHGHGRRAHPIPSYIVHSTQFSVLRSLSLSSQFPVPCSFNPVRNRNRNPTQRTYNLSASNGNQTVAGRVSERERGRERKRGKRVIEREGNNNNNACNTNSN